MNKVMTAAIVAGGLMLLNSPEAAAHKDGRHSYQPSPYYHYDYRVDVRRSKHMPRWLKRNDSFQHWYKRTSLRQDRRIAWGELFEIYRWEYRQGSYYDKQYRRDDQYRDRNYRDHRKGRKDKRRHRH